MMAKEMKRRDVETALNAQNCRVLRNRGDHVVYACPCGQHQFQLPKHNRTSPGVVRDAIQKLACLPKGWLQ